MRGKPQRTIQRRTHAVRQGLKANAHSAPGVIRTGVREVEGEEGLLYTNLTTQRSDPTLYFRRRRLRWFGHVERKEDAN